ncbi:MAG: AlpA family phage regulatory protein [Deltaproteobacteria bacterium]|jgi:predicted DNA-binding transcriptional regulator AlpA|nr:AlpA family phage regulatory protein [Deltaproteobacteria bacterium]
MSDIDRLVPDRLIRARQVSSITGLGLATVYDYIKRGLFPGGYLIGTRNKAWSLEAVNRWVADRKAGIPLEKGQYCPVKAANGREALTLLGQLARKESR